MRKAYKKDIWRAIWKGKKRFISILLITALGVMMFTGLGAACLDLRYSADAFLDAQRLSDICVVSTLGLTDEDVEALAGLEGIAVAEGSYSETVTSYVGDRSLSALVRTYREDMINLPYLMEGRFPEKTDEMAVTPKFVSETGCGIGDTVRIEEDSVDDDADKTDTDTTDDDATDEDEEQENNFLHQEYVITGIVLDPQDFNNTEGVISFRGSSTDESTVFVREEAADFEVYTAVYLLIEGGSEMFCYSDEYEERVAELTGRIEEEIKEQREQARYDEITGEAYEKLGDARAEADEKLSDAKKELDDAQEEIDEGWQELNDGEQELNDGEKELADGEKELLDGEREAAEEIAKAREEIADGYAQIEEGKTQLDQAMGGLLAGSDQLAAAKEELAAKESDAYAQLAAGRAALEENLAAAAGTKEELTGQLAAVTGMFAGGFPQAQWDAYVQALTEMYVPVIEEQLAAGAADAGSADASAPLPDAGMLPEQVQAAQQAFLAAFSQVTDPMKAGIDQQIAMLDPNVPEQAQQIAMLTAQKQQLDALPEQLLLLASGLGQVQATQQVLNGQLALLAEQEQTAKEQFAAAWQQIADNEQSILEGKQQIDSGYASLLLAREEIAKGEEELNQKEEEVRQELADGRKELEDGRKELEDGRKELEDARQELLDGEEELADGWEEYEEKRLEAEEELADAEREIADIDMTRWYVQDRTSLSAYANVVSDAGSIEAIGTVFPSLFLIVAVLISLTTITRMVEEDRGLIGTYKALGFTDMEIRRKYLRYALLAGTFGCLLGLFGGFVVLPEIIFIIFDVMYLLPEYAIRVNPVSGAAGSLLFIGGIVCATLAACRTELKQTPAALMRPKSPRSGSRVLLEYITPVWNRFSFLNKVTARNLFRYKKRLFMTVAGIMGCMALLLFGFAIKDSVTDLMPRQYEQVYRYDLMAVASDGDNETLLAYVTKDDQTEDVLNLMITSVKLINADGRAEKVQMFVIPEDADLSDYIRLESPDGRMLTLSDDGVFITQNAANILGLSPGDTAVLQDMDLKQAKLPVTEVVKHYLGNSVYLTEAAYEELFGEYEPNGVLVHFSEQCKDPSAYAKGLGEQDGVLSSVSTEELKEEFSSAFALINMLVYIVIVMSACLAFTVLFTLATTNISERNRELATIKVLGFFDREVHLYVDKETLILTVFGIILGVPLGYGFAQTLTYVLNMPSIYLAVSLHPVSYAMAAGISFGFALIVNLITDRMLDGIDPVEALKSIE